MPPLRSDRKRQAVWPTSDTRMKSGVLAVAHLAFTYGAMEPCSSEISFGRNPGGLLLRLQGSCCTDHGGAGFVTARWRLNGQTEPRAQGEYQV